MGHSQQRVSTHSIAHTKGARDEEGKARNSGRAISTYTALITTNRLKQKYFALKQFLDVI